MTLFKNNCIIACLAYLLTIIGFVALTAGFFTPFWNVSTDVSGTKTFSGLIMTCSSSYSCSFDIAQIEKFAKGDFSGIQVGSMTLGIAGWVFGLITLIIVIIYSCFPITVTGILAIIGAIISDFSGFQIGAMTLGIAGWVLGLVALIIIMVYSCFPITVTGVLAFIFALLSGVSGAACVIIYGSGIPNLTQVSVSWSLGLFTGGSALMIAVGILLIINVCVL